MRFFEFKGTGDPTERYVVILKNIIGRYASKKQPAKLNWASLNKMVNTAGIETTADYETFKAMYDSNPAVQGLVKNFNADGIELNVPGVEEEPTDQTAAAADGTAEPSDSQAAVDATAAAAAPGNLG